MPGINDNKENLRNLKNADITNIIEQMMAKLANLLTSNQARDCSMTPLPVIPPMRIETIKDQLLSKRNHADKSALTLEELNSNYVHQLGNDGNDGKPLISVPSNATKQDKEDIAKAAVLHIKAVVNGFKMGAQNTTTFDQPLRQENGRAVREVHHHYHGCRDNFWRDLMLYDLLFNSTRDTCHHHSRPTSSTNRSKKEENQVTFARILLAVGMIAGALATAGYDVMQTYQRVDEIVHGEDILGNTAKLSVTAFAAFSGYLLGAMIGASCFANPILGGVCLAFITAAAGMAAAKWLVGKIHALDKNDSASLTDPRFCLTKKEEQRLIAQGTNPEVAKELLRECAMAIANEPTNGLVFWQNPHKEIIAIARKVKAGTIEEVITMDMTHKVINRIGQNNVEKVTLSKEFDLKKPMELGSAVMEGDNVDNNVSEYFTASNEKSPLLASSFYRQPNNATEGIAIPIPSAPPALNKGDESWSNVPVATEVRVVGLG